MTSPTVALVTGASGGIGSAIAERLARHVDRVVLHHHHDHDAVEQVAERVRSAGGNCRTVDADLSDPREGARMVEDAASHARLHVLVNSAGVMTEWIEGDQHTVLADWDRTVAINLTATFATSRAAVGAMGSAGGAIVNLSSQLAFKGAAGLVPYCASKAGVVGLTRALAREVGPTIRVYALAPGPVETPMIAGYADEEWRRQRTASLISGAIADPADIARVVDFLVDDRAGLLQGQTLHCNGGGVLA